MAWDIGAYKAAAGGPATVEASVNFDLQVSAANTSAATAQATTTAAINLTSSTAATAIVQATTTDNLDSGFTVTAEVIQLTGLNNNRISAMHFQRHYEPIAVGS